VWRSLRRDVVFPTRPLGGLLGFLGRSNHLVPNSGIRRLLREHLRFDRMQQAAIPFHVVATDVLTGEDVLVSGGDAVEAILASAAIPGVLPLVRIDGRDLMDGGVVNNTPISHVVSLGADVIWVLATGYACALREAPGSALGMALHTATIMIHQRLATDVERYEGEADLRVVPPLCPATAAPTDFSQAAELIERGYRMTRDWLAGGRPAAGQAGLLRPHRHDTTRGRPGGSGDPVPGQRRGG
jgi:NTE family protein